MDLRVTLDLFGKVLGYDRALRKHGNLVGQAQLRGEALTIDVVDNGGGVDRKEAGAVFEKFTRGSRAWLDQGAGLGLPISRAIMRTMGGDLTVEFGPRGSTFFRVRLAIAEAAGPLKAAAGE